MRPGCSRQCFSEAGRAAPVRAGWQRRKGGFRGAARPADADVRDAGQAATRHRAAGAEGSRPLLHFCLSSAK